jgi:hypothetical protein
MDIVDLIYNDDGSVTYVYSNGTTKTVMPDGGSGGSGGSTNTGSAGSNSGGGSGWLAGVLSAVPGILSALFPNGIGNNNNNPGTVYTNPATGTTAVNLAGGGTNPILLIGLALMAGFLLSGQQLKAKK